MAIFPRSVKLPGTFRPSGAAGGGSDDHLCEPPVLLRGVGVALLEDLVEVGEAREAAVAADLLDRHVGHDELGAGILHLLVVDQFGECHRGMLAHHAVYIVDILVAQGGELRTPPP